ncbi:MAG TPA: MurR/RpiR family transcriptional regulator [Burkholderiaceae bacterium]|nr:MurR/RpiR family transcriptional regulator [Burkholderiaceae bacterium]
MQTAGAAHEKRPTSYDELAARITQRFPHLPRQLQAIARFALDAPEDFALGTAAQVAEQIGVQPSALIRFANAVGCDGFAEVRQLFRRQLRARTLSYRERIEQMRAHASAPGTAPMGVLRSFVHDSIDQLRRFEGAIDEHTLTRAVAAIALAPHVHLLAARRSFPVASYLAYALNQLEKRSSLIDGVGLMQREFAARIAPGELLIAISFRNYTPEVIEITQAAHARGVQVIAITDSRVSPLARAADFSFELGDDGAAPFRSLVEPIVLAQTLVVAVGHQLAERAARNGASPPKRARARNGSTRK